MKVNRRNIQSILGVNGGTCSNLGNGLFVCACPAGFTGHDCSISHCVKESCFNGGTCLIENNSHHCQCSCGFTGKNLHDYFHEIEFSVDLGSRCETPFDVCSVVTCQNNGTRLLNSTQCQCSCVCPSTFTGPLCQIPIVPVNRTYPGQIVMPVSPSSSSWDAVVQCIDQVWNSLNVLLGKNNLFISVKNQFFELFSLSFTLYIGESDLVLSLLLSNQSGKCFEKSIGSN